MNNLFCVMCPNDQNVVGPFEDRDLANEWIAEDAEDRKLQQTPSAFEPGCCG